MSDLPWGLRQEVLARDNYECQGCGKNGDGGEVEIHHKTPRSEGGSDKMTNLTTLCKDCHSAVHNLPAVLSNDGINFEVLKIGVGHLVDCEPLCYDDGRERNLEQEEVHPTNLEIDCKSCLSRLRKICPHLVENEQSHMQYLEDLSSKVSDADLKEL